MRLLLVLFFFFFSLHFSHMSHARTRTYTITLKPENTRRSYEIAQLKTKWRFSDTTPPNTVLRGGVFFLKNSKKFKNLEGLPDRILCLSAKIIIIHHPQLTRTKPTWIYIASKEEGRKNIQTRVSCHLQKYVVKREALFRWTVSHIDGETGANGESRLHGAGGVILFTRQWGGTYNAAIIGPGYRSDHPDRINNVCFPQ